MKKHKNGRVSRKRETRFLDVLGVVEFRRIYEKVADIRQCRQEDDAAVADALTTLASKSLPGIKFIPGQVQRYRRRHGIEQTFFGGPTPSACKGPTFAASRGTVEIDYEKLSDLVAEKVVRRLANRTARKTSIRVAREVKALLRGKKKARKHTRMSAKRRMCLALSAEFGRHMRNHVHGKKSDVGCAYCQCGVTSKGEGQAVLARRFEENGLVSKKEAVA